jgi:hypothetical protein
MGSTAGTIVRAVTAVSTGGVSELARKKPFQSGGGTDLRGAVTTAALGPYGAGVSAASGTKIDTPVKSAPIIDTPVKPGQTDADREREARVAAARRRKDFQNLGRSGTIITGPGGLTGSGPGAAKTLLGS